ncbi:hypothetical protein VQ042_20860 [Aurantimonas sp. A2-1-M11]|uniref:hypothetical protein n=1 Tax=Aurantimonas sp. A2-1-M11 TaxID=3113712 RepID=UPI002F94094B
MVATRTVRIGVNENVMRENVHPGEFLVTEYAANHCRENVVVNGGVSGVAHNSVLIDGDKAFAGIVFEGVAAGRSDPRAVLMRGPAEVSLARLVFPSDPAAADGDVNGEISEAEQAAADDALRTALIAEIEAAGIVVRS